MTLCMYMQCLKTRAYLGGRRGHGSPPKLFEFNREIKVFSEVTATKRRYLKKGSNEFEAHIH